LDRFCRRRLPIPWHAFAALAALAIGGAQLALPKGTMRHRPLGYAWVALMLVIAISSFWIQQIRLVGPFSPIHLLSILVLVTVPLAAWYAHTHKVGAGIFTLLPGRIMHAVVFGQ